MFFVRLLVLGFLAAFSLSMGQQGQLNTIGNVIAVSFFLWVPLLYLLPTYEAWRLKHANLMPIALVNIFLGWTLLGWVVALVWAFTRPAPARA